MMKGKIITPTARRRSKVVYSEKTRVITRPFMPESDLRTNNIIKRVLNLNESEVGDVLNEVLAEFSDRHRGFFDTLDKHFQRVERFMPPDIKISKERRQLIGAYFTMEYSVEAAAIFNPSIVLHPDQSGLKEKTCRFIMSFRATGEGHISSIEFKSGLINRQNDIFFDPVSPYVETPDIHTDLTYNKHLFQLKIHEMGAANNDTHTVLSMLPDEFTLEELTNAISFFTGEEFNAGEKKRAESVSIMMWLARSNYEVTFDPNHDISERVIFPVSENENRGIEDARFVQFTNDDGKITYYAPYTAYNGFNILPQLIETKDFIQFKIITLNGRAVQNKGMALFPRLVNGKYVMLSRQDGENNHIMFSDHLHFWQESTIIQEPKHYWEFIQIGNCGSPIEIDEGWLLLTHGVGPMRKYCIGIKLLDTDDPAKVIGHMDNPILIPNNSEREGYVPNVVYSCGAMIHNDELIIPYAMSDSRSGIASIAISDILSNMRYVKPVSG